MLRDEFPEAGQAFQGATSPDGWEWRTAFAGSTLEASLAMLRAFLLEEGYADVPLPADAAEMRLFRRPRGSQIALFEDRGYSHNPIKILFPPDPRRAKTTLILCVFNEKMPQHLIRFHGVLKDKKS